MSKKNIVVLGGGIGGMEFLTQITRKLDHSAYQLSLIDKNELHIWKPMLHTFAAGSALPSEQGINFLHQAKRHDFLFHPGEVTKLDLKAKKITLKSYSNKKGKEILPERHIDYDYLVIALGSKTNDFNTKGVKEHAYAIDDLDHATRFYDDLRNYIIQAAILKEKHHVAIVGAGATGVELAGEIIYQITQSSQYVDHDFKKHLQLTVIQSGDKILPSFKDEVGDAAAQTMKDIGIRLVLSERVAEITPHSVILKSGEVLPADQVAWTTGVKGPDFFDQMEAIERSERSQLVVNSKLQLISHPDVFVIGDCSFIKDHPLPPTAQVATQEAAYLSSHFEQLISSPTEVPSFRFMNYGSLVSVGRYQSFGVFGHNMAIKGIVAKLAHIFLYRRHQIRILGAWRALCSVLADQFRSQSR